MWEVPRWGIRRARRRPPRPAGNTKATGYGYAHQAERRRWQRQLNQGLAVRCPCFGECLRHQGQCLVIITAAAAWDLMHTADRTGYLGPGCVPCNRAEGAHRSNGVAPTLPGFAHADRW